jgi:hypothetical protein
MMLRCCDFGSTKFLRERVVDVPLQTDAVGRGERDQPDHVVVVALEPRHLIGGPRDLRRILLPDRDGGESA